MAYHPINLVLRFLLEMTALLSMGYWAWGQGEGWVRMLLVIAIPLIAAITWGVFNVPNDPSRSGHAPVAVRGWFRLLLELLFFSVAIWMLADVQKFGFAWIFAVLTAMHYLVSLKRISRLIDQ